MTLKEYLNQAHRLDQKISADIAEADRLRQMLDGVSAPSLEENYNASRNTEAPYVRRIEKIIMLEETINAEIDHLIDLKAQIRETIESVPDLNEKLVLLYRYTECLTWEQIAEKMSANSSTVRRWHKNALVHAKMPKNPILI